jgi:hypothetical protein
MDAELLGWMQSIGDGFIAIDLLGWSRTGIVDWLTAEETLESLGIGYLAEPFELLLDTGEWLRVRVTEVSTDGIRVKKDDWGATGAPQMFYALDFPVPKETFRSLDN